MPQRVRVNRAGWRRLVDLASRDECFWRCILLEGRAGTRAKVRRAGTAVAWGRAVVPRRSDRGECDGHVPPGSRIMRSDRTVSGSVGARKQELRPADNHRQRIIQFVPGPPREFGKGLELELPGADHLHDRSVDEATRRRSGACVPARPDRRPVPPTIPRRGGRRSRRRGT